MAPDKSMSFDEAMTELEKIKKLIDQGILDREACPTPDYWHWRILKPDELPEEYAEFIPLGEVRW